MTVNDISSLLVLNAVIIGIFIAGVWLISLMVRNASIMDIFWGPGFILVAWLSWFITDGYPLRKLLLTALPTVWGLRLALYIFLRNRGEPEDYRYRAMREKHGSRFWIVSLFTVFVLQGIIMFIVSLPIQVGQIHHMPDRLIWLDIIGVMLWLTGFLFESIGDFQLARFKSDPKNRGEVMNRGLWKYTRHPNYFGESLIWWGLYAISASGGVLLWTIVGPILMTFLLVRVSGVALLEKSLVTTKPHYADYIRTTSGFIPWFRSKKKNNDS